METQSAAKKLQPVTTAVKLLWASLAVLFVRMLMYFFRGGAPVMSAYFLIYILILVGFIALLSLLVFKISAGSYRARKAFLAIFVIHILILMLTPFPPSIIGALAVVQLGLQAFALMMLLSQHRSVQALLLHVIEEIKLVNMKALMIGIALSVLMPMAVESIYNYRSEFAESTPLGQPLLTVGWAWEYFVPTFVAVIIAKNTGWLYALILGIISIGYLSGFEFTQFEILIVFGFAGIGAFLGQWATHAKKRSEPILPAVQAESL